MGSPGWGERGHLRNQAEPLSLSVELEHVGLSCVPPLQAQGIGEPPASRWDRRVPVTALRKPFKVFHDSSVPPAFWVPGLSAWCHPLEAPRC